MRCFFIREKKAKLNVLDLFCKLNFTTCLKALKILVIWFGQNFYDWKLFLTSFISLFLFVHYRIYLLLTLEIVFYPSIKMSSEGPLKSFFGTFKRFLLTEKNQITVPIIEINKCSIVISEPKNLIIWKWNFLTPLSRESRTYCICTYMGVAFFL